MESARPHWRSNDEQLWAECLEDHLVLGVRGPQGLVAAAVLYEPGDGPESIKAYLKRSEGRGTACNLKVVLVDPDQRRSGIAQILLDFLVREARERAHEQVLCTIHKDNQPSAKLFRHAGFRRAGKAATAYGPRHVYALALSTGT